MLDTVSEAVKKAGANTAMVFVPAPFAADAMYEAIAAGVHTVICITEGVPVHEMLPYPRAGPRARRHAHRAELPGRALPGEGERRDHPGRDLPRGRRGPRLALGHAHVPDRPRADAARARQLDDRRDRRGSVVGSSFVDMLSRFEADPQTEQVVMVGEIGGDEEEKAAAYIEAEMTKPVVAYIAGFTAPPGKTMEHAGRDHLGLCGDGRRRRRTRSRRKGIRVGTTPTETAQLVAEVNAA